MAMSIVMSIALFDESVDMGAGAEFVNVWDFSL